MGPITDFFRENQALFNGLVDLVMIGAPIFITWFIRNYVKSASDEKKLALASELANLSIGYVEDLHKNGRLNDILKNFNLSDEFIEGASTGLKKLHLASATLETELEKRGIKMTREEAEKVIRGEFQKVAEGLEAKHDITNRAKELIELITILREAGVIPDLKTPAGPAALLPQAAQFIEGSSTPAPQPAQLIEALPNDQPSPPPEPPLPSTETHLAELARQSVAYVDELKSIKQLTLPEGDIAAAWILTEVTKQGLEVNTEQIANAVYEAFAQRRATLQSNLS